MNDISSTGVTSFTSVQLERVATLFADPVALRKKLGPADDTRRRIEVERSKHLQIWAISWPPGTSTPWHDHGQCQGAFVVVEGEIAETTFEETAITQVLTAGESTDIPPQKIHRTACHGSQPALTVHAYAPALDKQTIYELVGGVLTPHV